MLARRTVCLALIFSVSLLCPEIVSAQKDRKNFEVKTIRAKDGWPIHLNYFKQEGNRDAPVIIMLHSSRGDRRVWMAGFAEQMWKAGFAVIAADLRKHGESKLETATGAATDSGDISPDDYKKMVAYDLEAIKDFIYEEHQNQNLNMRKTGIIAPEMSAPVAINWAAFDWGKAPYQDAPVASLFTPRGQDVRAIALLSPEASVKGMSTTRPLRDLRSPAKNIAFLFMYGTDDNLDKGDTVKMHKAIVGRSDSDRVYLEEYPYNLRGMALLGKKLKVEAHMEAFFKKHLLELDDEWVDRRSRLER